MLEGVPAEKQSSGEGKDYSHLSVSWNAEGQGIWVCIPMPDETATDTWLEVSNILLGSVGSNALCEKRMERGRLKWEL